MRCVCLLHEIFMQRSEYFCAPVAKKEIISRAKIIDTCFIVRSNATHLRIYKNIYYEFARTPQRETLLSKILLNNVLGLFQCSL